METPEYTRSSLRDFLNILFKRKFYILGFFAVVVSIAVVATLLMKPAFQAKGQILVKIGRESIYLPTTGSGSPVISINREEQINSEIEILKSQSLINEVVATMGAEAIYPNLVKNEQVAQAGVVPAARESDDIAQQALLTLQNNLEVAGIKKSNVIEVSFKHSDPHIAAEVVDTLARLYLDRHVDVHKTPHSYSFFQEQSELLKNKLNQSEARLESLKTEHNVTELEEQQTILLQRINDQRMQLNQTWSEEVEAENRIKQLEQQLNEIPRRITQGEEIDNNPLIISTLESRLVELQLEEEELLRKYTEQSRMVQNVRGEIRVVRQKLAEQAKKRHGKTHSGVNPTYQHLHEELLRTRANLKALRAKSASQKQQLTAYQDELAGLNKIEVLYNQLQQAVEVDRENYQLYLTKFEESRISDAMDSHKITSVSLIEPVQIPLQPVSPRKAMNLMLGIILGAFGGLVLAFSLEYMDDSLNTIDDVEEHLQPPLVISVPHTKEDVV